MQALEALHSVGCGMVEVLNVTMDKGRREEEEEKRLKRSKMPKREEVGPRDRLHVTGSTTSFPAPIKETHNEHNTMQHNAIELTLLSTTLQLQATS